MSYAIGEVIYGIDLTDKLNNSSVVDFFTDEFQNIHSPYSSGGDGYIAFGVELNSIDECRTVDIQKDIISQFTPSVKEEYKKILTNFINEMDLLINELDKEEKKEAKKIFEYIKTTEPKEIIIWGGS